MDNRLAEQLVNKTFQNSFDKGQFIYFTKNLLNQINESKAFHVRGYVHEKYRDQVKTYERIGTYTDPENKKIDILIVYLQKENSIDRARTTLRNFVGDYLKERGEKEAGLIAFVSPNQKDWRFSLVKMEYKLVETPSGKIKGKEEFTPAKRYSFLVGLEETSHTAQSRLVPILEDDANNPTLKQLEEAFNIEKVTKEFFEKYRKLYLWAKETLDEVLKKDKAIKADFFGKNIDTIDFTKKLLGQIVFLYFLQKKGWFGVKRGKEWGSGSKHFLRELFNKNHGNYKNFFNEILEPLFYEALRNDRSHEDHYFSQFKCRIPFLNGGLFDPLGNYDWVNTDILLPNELFSNDYKTKEGDTGTGILDVFDRYNFTVKEDEPLEKEVAVDPEMLGKVFENLLEVKDRKSKGTYYTPREIVHYMCQESLTNYLATELKGKVSKNDIEMLIKYGETVVEHEAEVESRGKETKIYSHKLPKSIRDNANLIDEKLETIRICDPAVGSGAFPVGMMNEIIRTRNALTNYLKTKKGRTIYDFKRHAIQNCLYGVDIDLGAVEIAKLRLWLSLIVDEEDIKQIKPLPNLDYKIMQGNSLLEEFEGIKIFDEKLLRISVIDSEILDPVNQKIIGLQSKLLQFYQKNPKWMQKGEHQNKPQEVIILESQLRDILKKHKKIQEQSTEQKDLFASIAESRAIRDELDNYHKQFFGETNPERKEELKRAIENLEWELIEATLKEQNKISVLKKLEEFKRLNIKPFFLWKFNFADVFEEKGGFDVVIANPPYIRQEEISYKQALEKKYEIFNSVSDLYTYFYERGFKLLHDRGVLIFITSNKFLRAQYGTFLRRYLQTNTTIRSIINFGDQHMFKAITNTLIFIATKGNGENNKLNYSDNINEPDKIKFSQSELQDSEWTIEKPEVIHLKNKIEGLGISLKDWDVRINYGIKTGYNEAFVIDKETRDKIVSRNSSAAEIIKPIIRGRDIERYYYNESGLYLINVHNGYKVDDGSKVEAVDIKDYPAIGSHLDQYHKKLAERQDKGKTIYNLRDCAFIQDFSKEKIIWIELTNKNRFSYSDKEDYLLAGAFFMVGESLKYLLAFLNSKLCYFYFSLICNSSGMATIQWKKFALEKIPIMKINGKEQKPLIDLVNKIITITKDKDYLENLNKQTKVRDYEKQIDQMVYKLYGLTPEEVKVIEDCIK